MSMYHVLKDVYWVFFNRIYPSLLKEDDGRSYRRAISKTRTLLTKQGLPIPSFDTLYRSQEKFEKGQLGIRIFNEATVMLLSLGIKEAMDPIRILNSGVFPEYEGPSILVTCQKDVVRQNMLDKEAESLRDSMEVMVMRSAVDDGRPHSCAMDGSGQGTSGPGIYFEHIWVTSDRRFIKQHTMLDLDSKRVVSFAVTLEKPGDAKMFIPLVSGAMLVGVKVFWVSADSAYDTKANWSFMDENGIAFCPNLKEKFKGDWELKRREALHSFDEEFGKDIAHRITGYNKRWLIEAFFSVFKKLYGERVDNRNFDRMVITMKYRYTLYDIHRDFILEAMSEA